MEKRGFDWRRLWPLLFFGLCLLRFCYYGCTYLPLLDDSIQYHNYAFFGDGLWAEVERMSLLGARPLAGILDIGFWSLFFEHLFWAIVLITALFTGAAFFFERAFAKAFGCSPLFYALLLLTPVNFEGTYWLSASSRVVVGMFFAGLSVYLFSRYAESGKARYIPLFAVAGLAACGFYEQTLVLSVAGVLLLGIFYWKKLRARALFALLTLLNAGIYFGFTGFFKSTGIYAERSGGTILPFASNFYNTKVWPALLEQLKGAFIDAPAAITGRGFVRGAQLLCEGPNLLWILAAVALLALLGFALLWRRGRAEPAPVRPAVWGIVVGVLLALAPIAPFLILDNPWVSLRSVCCSLVGAALVADRAVALLLRPVPVRRGVTAGLTLALSAFFLVGSISELSDYRQTGEDDRRIVDDILEEVGDERPEEDWESSIVVLGLRPSYLAEQNYAHNEHIHGVTESDWALYGALLCRSEDIGTPTAVPVPFGDVTAKLPQIENGYLYLFADERGEISRVRRRGERFYSEQGEPVAALVTEGERTTLVAQ